MTRGGLPAARSLACSLVQACCRMLGPMSTVARVAALYIDPRGPYPSMAGVDCWALDRDACQYRGPLPVVAHPPCAPWGRLAHLAQGADPFCAVRAVHQVRQFGGVLEHPAHSRLWARCRLPVPEGLPDAWGGFSLAVQQVSWGHVARKPTWLYFCGVDRGLVEATRRRGGTPTHWISGGRQLVRRGFGGRVPAGIKVASERQRRRTPQAFGEWLVMLAATAQPAGRARGTVQAGKAARWPAGKLATQPMST